MGCNGSKHSLSTPISPANRVRAIGSPSNPTIRISSTTVEPPRTKICIKSETESKLNEFRDLVTSFRIEAPKHRKSNDDSGPRNPDELNMIIKDLERNLGPGSRLMKALRTITHGDPRYEPISQAVAYFRDCLEAVDVEARDQEIFELAQPGNRPMDKNEWIAESLSRAVLLLNALEGRSSDPGNALQVAVHSTSSRISFGTSHRGHVGNIPDEQIRMRPGPSRYVVQVSATQDTVKLMLGHGAMRANVYRSSLDLINEFLRHVITYRNAVGEGGGSVEGKILQDHIKHQLIPFVNGYYKLEPRLNSGAVEKLSYLADIGSQEDGYMNEKGRRKVIRFEAWIEETLDEAHSIRQKMRDVMNFKQ